MVCAILSAPIAGPDSVLTGYSVKYDATATLSNGVTIHHTNEANPSTPGSSSTNATNSTMRVTRPVRTWPISYVASTLDQGSAVNCFNSRAICCLSSVG